MAVRRTDAEKFQTFFDLVEADDADTEPEVKHDLYVRYFPTAAQAKAYRNWKAANGKSTKTQQTARPPSPTRPNPQPLHVYRDQLANVDFGPNGSQSVREYVFSSQ